MDARIAADPEVVIRRTLRRISLRGIGWRAAYGLLRSLTVLVVLLAAGVTADYLWALEPVPRALLLLAGTATLGGVFYGWVARAVVRPPPLLQVARDVEILHPEMMDGISAAIALATEGAPADVLQVVRERAARDVDRLGRRDTAHLFASDRGRTGREAVRLAGLVVGGVIATVVAGIDLGAHLDRLLHPGGGTPYPTRTRIALVRPGDVITVAGRTLEWAVETSGRRADEVAVDIVWDQGGQSRALLFPAAELRTYSGTVVVEGGAWYTVEAGDARSRPFRISCRSEPRVASVAVRVVPPAYSDLPEEVQAGGSIRALTGSLAQVIARPTDPPRTAWLETAGERVAMAIPDAGGEMMMVGEMRIRRSGSYRISYVAQDGTESQDPIEYRIDATPDRPPTADILGPPARTARPGDVVPLDYAVGDDLGLGPCRLRVEGFAGTAALEHAFPLEASGLESHGTFPLDTGAMGVPRGGTIEVRVEALDRRTPDPNRTLSRTVRIHVEGSPQEIAALGQPPATPRPPSSTPPTPPPSEPSCPIHGPG